MEPVDKQDIIDIFKEFKKRGCSRLSIEQVIALISVTPYLEAVPKEQYQRMVQRVAELTIALTEKKPEWIPCNERLPKSSGLYLVCGQWRGEDPKVWVCSFEVASYMSGWINDVNNPVIEAWMPLPDPYEGREDG